MSWQGKAYCSQVGGDLWYPDPGGSSRAAIDICNSCPVIVECLEDALASETDGNRFGIRGGLSALGRKELRNERKKVRR